MGKAKYGKNNQEKKYWPEGILGSLAFSFQSVFFCNWWILTQSIWDLSLFWLLIWDYYGLHKWFVLCSPSALKIWNHVKTLMMIDIILLNCLLTMIFYHFYYSWKWDLKLISGTIIFHFLFSTALSVLIVPPFKLSAV